MHTKTYVNTYTKKVISKNPSFYITIQNFFLPINSYAKWYIFTQNESTLMDFNKDKFYQILIRKFSNAAVQCMIMQQKKITRLAIASKRKWYFYTSNFSLRTEMSPIIEHGWHILTVLVSHTVTLQISVCSLPQIVFCHQLCMIG